MFVSYTPDYGEFGRVTWSCEAEQSVEVRFMRSGGMFPAKMVRLATEEELAA